MHGIYGIAKFSPRELRGHEENRGQHKKTGHGRAEPRDERTSQANHEGWLGVRPHGGAEAHGGRSATS